MAKKRLLTWHGPSKRWKKQIDCVVRYFGHGSSDRDLKSYRAAERKYLEFMAERERQKPIEIPLTRATVNDVCEKYLRGSS